MKKNTTFFPNSMAAFPKYEEDSALLSQKLDGLNLYRSGAFQTDSETITRNADTSEIEFESRNEYCQFQEHEYLNYRLKNIAEKSNVTTERVKSKNTVRQKKEVRETKIFLIERRPSTLPLRFVVALWRQLKRLTHVATSNQTATSSAAENHKVAHVEAKKQRNELEDVNGEVLLTESLGRTLPFSEGDGKFISRGSELNALEPPLEFGNRKPTQHDRDFDRPTTISNMPKKFFTFKIVSTKKRSATGEPVSTKI